MTGTAEIHQSRPIVAKAIVNPIKARVGLLVSFIHCQPKVKLQRTNIHDMSTNRDTDMCVLMEVRLKIASLVLCHSRNKCVWYDVLVVNCIHFDEKEGEMCKIL